MTLILKILIKVSLYTWLFPIKLSSIIFKVVPSSVKLICSVTRALFVTLFAVHKIHKTLIVTVQAIVNLKSVSSHSAANIEASVTLLQISHRRLPHFEESTFLCNGYNLALTK